MKLATTKNANLNYLAKIVKIENFTPHPDPETTRLKVAHIDGFNLVVGIDSQPGIYVYFPTSCEINPQLLAYGNLYKHSEKNNHPEDKPGFFEDNGRVKAIRLRGVVSEGFLMDWTLFNNFLVDNLNKTIEPEINKEFNCIKEDNKEVWICKKYIIKTSIPQSKGVSRYQKRVKKFNRVIDTQFRFHYETSIYRKVPTFIQPNDLISVTSKIHGCVDANTIINTNEGKKTIKEIVDNKLNVLIEAFDINTQQKVFVPIDDYYLKENDGDWYEVELENGQKIEITGNNPVWLPELNCYRRVDELLEGDIILFSDN